MISKRRVAQLEWHGAVSSESRTLLVESPTEEFVESEANYQPESN